MLATDISTVPVSFQAIEEPRGFRLGRFWIAPVLELCHLDETLLELGHFRVPFLFNRRIIGDLLFASEMLYENAAGCCMDGNCDDGDIVGVMCLWVPMMWVSFRIASVMVSGKMRLFSVA